MDSRRRFTEEFRIEAAKQITERGFAVKDVSQRLGVDLLPRVGQVETRKSGWGEIHKTCLQTALVWCHPAMSAGGNDCNPVSSFRFSFGHRRVT